MAAARAARLRASRLSTTPHSATFHGERFRPASLSLVLVGDIDTGRAIDAAARAFGAWAGAPPAASTLREAPAAAARRARVIPMMNKSQADIAYGFTSLRRSDPEYYAYWLMNNILGQYAIGGRLGDRIRERDGMAYYAFSALDANVIPGPLTIRAGVSPDNVDRAVAAIDEELQSFGERRPDGQRNDGIAAVPDRFDAEDARDEPWHREFSADGRVLRTRPRL